MIGCPECGTIQNAEVAKCNGLWHSANRDGKSILQVNLDFSEGVCGVYLPGSAITTCGIPVKDGELLHTLWNGHLAKTADGHVCWPVLKPMTEEAFRQYVRNNLGKLVEDEKGDEFAAAVKFMEQTKSAISVIWPYLLDTINPVLGFLRRAGYDLKS